MLEQKYIDNLIKLKDWLLANRGLVESHLNFKVYVNGSSINFLDPEDIGNDFIETITPGCNTNCCALGWAAISSLFSKDNLDWDLFAVKHFGCDANDKSTGEYLFGVHNPPDFHLMIDRFNYVITNGVAPASFIEFIKSMEEDDD